MNPGHWLGKRGFSAWLAAAFVAFTFAGFSTTYFIPVATGRFTGEPILHLHGLLFFAWPVLLLAQSLAIGRSRRWHRAMGLAGISLATAMVFAGLLAIGSSIRTWSDAGVGLEGQAISIVAFTGVALFAILFALGISLVRDRRAHARLMALATLAIMQGAWGRIALTLATGGNPAMLRPGLLPPPDPMLVTVTHLAFHAAVLGAIAFHDWHTMGRLHRVTMFGGGAVLVTIAFRPWFIDSAAWSAIATWLASL